MRSRLVSFVLPITLLAVFVTPRAASALWPTYGRNLSSAVGNEWLPSITTDGAGGAIVTWFDGPYNIDAQHVLASGNLDPAWPVHGKVVCAGCGAFPTIAPDGAGGAIITWQDDQGVVSDWDVRAQHVLGSGAVDAAWPAAGAALCTAVLQQDGPKIVPDGSGGAIVTWQDLRSSVFKVYAQHVFSSGVVDAAWPGNGRALCSAAGHQLYPALVPDGSGGAIVTWEDQRVGTSYHIYAQHVLSTGALDAAWPASGLAVCTVAGDQLNPMLVSDGAGGGIITWHDTRSGGVNHIYAEHVLSTGALDAAWPTTGLAVCTAAGGQEFPTLAPDGAGGAIVTWQDFRAGLYQNVYAQHVLASGGVDPAWPVDGSALSLAHRFQRYPVIVSDGAGGAIVSWQDLYLEYDLYAQHVLASGAIAPFWPPDGVAMCNLPGDQQSPVIVSNGAGGAIVAWQDYRSLTDTDVYAQVLVSSSVVNVAGTRPASEFSFALPSPNPARGPVTLRFALPREERVTLAVYDIGGRRVRTLESVGESAGEHAIAWDFRDDGGHAVGAGLYLARLEAEGRVITRRVARVN